MLKLAMSHGLRLGEKSGPRPGHAGISFEQSPSIR